MVQAFFSMALNWQTNLYLFVCGSANAWAVSRHSGRDDPFSKKIKAAEQTDKWQESDQMEMERGGNHLGKLDKLE